MEKLHESWYKVSKVNFTSTGKYRQMMKWDQRLTSGCNPSVECIMVRDIKSLYICTHLGVMPSLLVHKIIPFMCIDRDSDLVLCYA